MEVSLLGTDPDRRGLAFFKREGRFTPSTLVLLAVSTLVRIDMAVPFVVILIVLAVSAQT